MNATFLDAALDYRAQGMSVIPIRPKNKKPLIEWKEFQSRRAEESEIREWWQKTPDANIGMVTGKISGRSVIDIDTAEGGEALDEMVPDSWLTQMATTPRGGKHHHCEDADGVGNNAGAIPGVDFRGEGGFVVMPPSIGPNGNPYRWVDGYGPGQISLSPVPLAYLNLISNIACTNKATSVPTSQCATNLFQQGHRDEDLFHLANHLAKGGMQEQEIREVLVFVAKNCNPPFSEKEAQVKVTSALKRIERKGKNLTQEIRDWISSTSGVITSTFVDNEIGISTTFDKKTRSKIMTRLCDEGLIVRHGNKQGCYRILDQNEEAIDFLNAPTDEYDIRLPFDLHRHVKIFPGNIIIIAGEPNAGKTGLLLNIAKDNQAHQQVFYFSSEMGDTELRERLSLFDIPLDAWKTKFIDRSSNYSDVIRPDALNIVDFLEIHDEFWRVGQHLKDIYDRLNKGVAVIALQKKIGEDLGRGKEMSLEKARLYLSVKDNKTEREHPEGYKSKKFPG